MQNDDTCGEYWFENEYLEYLRKNHLALLDGVEVDGVQPAAVAPTVLGAPAVEGTEQNSGRLLEMLDIKVQIADLKADIANLKLEIKNLKNGGLSKPFVVSYALVAMVMLNIFVTILVAAIWK